MEKFIIKNKCKKKKREDETASKIEESCKREITNKEPQKITQKKSGNALEKFIQRKSITNRKYEKAGTEEKDKKSYSTGK